MRKLRDVLRLSLSAQLSIRAISRSTKLSVGAIQKLLKQASEIGLQWPLPDELDDARLASMFYPKAKSTGAGRFVVPDWPRIAMELRRQHVTKQLLWEEYVQEHPSRSYSYSQFCSRFMQWSKKQRRSMRQIHTAGEKCFVDYAGATVGIINGSTGEVRDAQIFVAVLGASSYTYAEATWTQSLPDWLDSHSHALSFFDGAPQIVVPDNLRSGVSRACRYDPDVNPSYQQWAEHYGVAVVPARPYKPKDKAKAEVAVQVVERWILARLRHQQFFSRAELNQCIRVLLVDLNGRSFKQLPGSRRSAFEMLDQPALQPLPAHAYQYIDIKPARVDIDYHIQYDGHRYSVPHAYVGERVEVHATNTIIEMFFQRRQIATHPRKRTGGYSTNAAHMPERHSAQEKWSPDRLERWAHSIGPATKAWVHH